MANAKFEIGDSVYVRESATKGFLENYTVVGINKDPTGFWKYSIGIAHSTPVINSTVGDRNVLKGNFLSPDLKFYEDELTTYCEALDLAIPVVLAQYNRLVKLRIQHCEDGGTGTD